jgi:hypothetical protein
MKLKIISIFALAVTISSCATTSSDPIAGAWIGKSAGVFFANFGPPVGDDGTGSVYAWKGGYKRVGGQLKSCSATVAVDSTYHIRALTITSDRPGEFSPSYCRELLAPNSVKPMADAKITKKS